MEDRKRRTTTKTYRVSTEVKAAIAAAATKYGGVDKALRELLIEHPKRCMGQSFGCLKCGQPLPTGVDFCAKCGPPGPGYDVKDAKSILVEKIPDDSVEGQLRRQIERQQL